MTIIPRKCCFSSILSNNKSITYGIKIFSESSQLMKPLLGVPKILSVIPWFHAYGMLTLFTVSVCGGRLVTMARYEDKLFLETIQVILKKRRRD